jgi:GNAT superfamily N-acetyltransferase
VTVRQDPGDAPVVRRAETRDAAAAAEVFTGARRSAGASLPPPVHTPEEDRGFVRDVLIGERETWLAEVDGRVVAVMTLDGDRLDQLYVAGAHTGRGVGSALVAHAKSRLPDGMKLWVFESNTPARRFYARHGFVEVERTDGAGNEERAPDVRMEWRP